MKIIVLLLAISLLVFGCFGIQIPGIGGSGAKENKTANVSANESEQGNKTIITIKNESTNRDEEKIPQLPNETVSKIKPGYTFAPNERFAVYFINVGKDELQGDAILIKKGDFDMLVDTGNARSNGKVVDFLKSKGVDDIEVLVSTNPDPQRYRGMQAVLDEFGVEEFWWSGKIYGDSSYDALVKEVNDQNIKMREVKRGDAETLNGLKVEVLNPSATKSFNDRDNDAIALKITENDFCVLLTGDILGGAQGELVNDPKINLRCNILEMPGYGLGRATAQIDYLLLKVKPNDVVFSGSSDDPSQDVKGTRFVTYEKLRLRNITYYENYKNGTVRIQSDGTNYAIDFLPN